MKKPTFKKAAIAACVVAVTTLPLNQALAVNWMENWYTQAGAAYNVTPGGSFMTQAGGFVTGGGLTARSPVNNVSLVSFTPPGFKAGCGGIDMWAGSFGFINKSQFVSFLRNIGQNALGLLFQVAIDSLDPLIGNIMKQMQQFAQTANSFNRNSCQAAHDLLNTGPGQKLQTAIKEAGHQLSTEFGVNSDVAVASSSEDGDESQAIADTSAALSSSPGLAQDSNGNKVLITQGNLTWAILSNGSLGTALSVDERQLIMSLIGTEVITPKDASGAQVSDSAGDASVSHGSYPPVLHVSDLLGEITQAPATSVTPTVYICDTTTNDGCLSPRALPTAIGKTFTQIVQAALYNIRNNIVGHNPQQTADVALVELTNVPIYRLLALTSEGPNAFMSDEVIQRYSGLIAAELLEHFVHEVDKQVTISLASPSLDAVKKDHIQKMADKIASLRQVVYQSHMSAEAKVGSLTAHIAEVEHLQRSLYTTLSSNYAANINFGRH